MKNKKIPGSLPSPGKLKKTFKRVIFPFPVHYEFVMFNNTDPGAIVKKLFTTVIYHYSMVMPSVCVIKLNIFEVTKEWQKITTAF